MQLVGQNQLAETAVEAHKAVIGQRTVHINIHNKLLKTPDMGFVSRVYKIYNLNILSQDT